MTRSPDKFHVKHRRTLPFLALAALAALLFVGCVPVAAPRGWAAAVESPDGNLLVTTARGRLEAINPNTGSAAWTFPNDWEIDNRDARRLQGIYAPPIVHDGTVYVADYNGFVYAFRPADVTGRTDGSKPQVRQIKRIGSPIIGSMAFDPSTNTLFVPSDDGRLHALNASDFSDRFEPIRAGDRIWSGPTLVGGNLFFASTDRKVYAHDARTGNQLWEPFLAGGSLVTQPVAANNNLLVGGFNNRLYALDSATGQERWTFVAENWIWSRPVVSGNTVYVADFNGKVYAVELGSGRALWDRPYEAEDSIKSAPVLAGGSLVVVTERGAIHAINPANGSRVWETVHLGGTVHADLVSIGTDRVIVTPSSCIERTQTDETQRKVNYFVLNPTNGQVTNVLADRGC